MSVRLTCNFIDRFIIYNIDQERIMFISRLPYSISYLYIN